MVGRTAAERGRDVRRRLLSAAVELIAERGWTAVSTRLLAERAGVAAGLVHYHFPSVQALLAEAAVGLIRDATAGFTPALLAAETPDRLVDTMVTALDEYTGQDPVSLVFVETYLAATRDADLRSAVAGVLAEVRGQLGTWLGEHGVPEPDHTASVLIAAVDGIVLHRTLNPDLGTEEAGAVLRRIMRGE